jgi:truncated hemoglobin YjbI
MAQTVLVHSGGFSRVRPLVAAIYDKALGHETLQRHFAHVDMLKLIDRQAKMIAGVMGGHDAFGDETVPRADVRHRITAEDIDDMGVILRQTLADFGYPPRDVDRMCNASVRRRLLAVEA